VIQKAVVESTAGGVATGLEKDALAAVSHKLAAYIGPIAEVVVKRAARRCTSLIDLCDSVAQEIEGSADRAKFLASCRH
jgi:serine/threonine-protein kinase